MKQTIDLYQFRQAFQDHNRQENFSYEGLGALFEWIEDLDDDCGTETELDVIALCCEFSEYDSTLACVTEGGYDWEPSDDELDQDEQEQEALDYLNDNTFVIVFDSGVIIQGF